MAKKIIIIVLVLAVLVGGVYVFMTRSDSNSASTQEPVTSGGVDSEDTSAEIGKTQQQPTNAGSTDTANTSTSIEIKEFAYSPAKVTVKKGTTVTWTNQDSMRHDVNPDNPTEEFEKSSLLAKGESYSVTFNTAGTYSYYCSPHPYMKGTITVTE